MDWKTVQGDGTQCGNVGLYLASEGDPDSDLALSMPALPPARNLREIGAIETGVAPSTGSVRQSPISARMRPT
jgi:hypothetical protein